MAGTSQEGVDLQDQGTLEAYIHLTRPLWAILTLHVCLEESISLWFTQNETAQLLNYAEFRESW